MPSGGVGEPQVQQRDLAAFLFYYITLILLDCWQATCISSREHCFVYLFVCLLYFIVCLFGWLVGLLACLLCLFVYLLVSAVAVAAAAISRLPKRQRTKMTSIEVLKLMLDSCSSGCPGGGRFRKEARCFFHLFSIGGGFKYFAYILGGGNSNIFFGHPYLGKIPILTNIFFRWVETTNQEVFHKLLCRFFWKNKDHSGIIKLFTHFGGMKPCKWL